MREKVNKIHRNHHSTVGKVLGPQGFSLEAPKSVVKVEQVFKFFVQGDA